VALLDPTVAPLGVKIPTLVLPPPLGVVCAPATRHDALLLWWNTDEGS
jgi:hypothetical protein